MSSLKRILVVEDNFIIGQELKSVLVELGYEVVGVAENLSLAKEFLKTLPDLILLDIRLGSEDDGYKIAELIDQEYQIPYLFLTAFSDKNSVLKGSSYNPAGYLVKPVDKNTLFSSMELAYSKAQKKDNTIKIAVGRSVRQVNEDDILWISAADVYLDVHLSSGETIVTRSSMDVFLRKVNTSKFIRIHRSYAVNKSKVDRIDAKNVFISNKELPLSRSFKDEVMRLF